jgi:hypothetical protein
MEKLKQIIRDVIIYRDEMSLIGRGIDLDSFLKSHPLLAGFCENCGENRKDIEIRCSYCGDQK